MALYRLAGCLFIILVGAPLLLLMIYASHILFFLLYSLKSDQFADPTSLLYAFTLSSKSPMTRTQAGPWLQRYLLIGFCGSLISWPFDNVSSRYITLLNNMSPIIHRIPLIRVITRCTLYQCVAPTPRALCKRVRGSHLTSFS